MSEGAASAAEARAAVLLISPRACALRVFAHLPSGRLAARGRRAVALSGESWPQARAALARLIEAARAHRADPVLVALRAPLRRARWRGLAAQQARRARCQFRALDEAEEARALFLGALRGSDALDGVVAEVEAEGIALARFRGRVLASTARIGLRARPAESGLPTAGLEGQPLFVSGEVVEALAARLDGRARGRQRRLTRRALEGFARAGRAHPLRPGALALLRLMDWAKTDAAVVSGGALAQGLAAITLRAALPSLSSAG
jgi:hypothetical protein